MIGSTRVPHTKHTYYRICVRRSVRLMCISGARQEVDKVRAIMCSSTASVATCKRIRTAAVVVDARLHLRLQFSSVGGSTQSHCTRAQSS